MNQSVCIPYSFLVVVDDVGWWCGNDQRYKNGPSRSGIERRHTIEDYKSIVALGKALDMRIKCGFVIGEWDRKNVLSKVRNSNKYGKDWDNASRLDPSIDEVRDLINANNEYMELAMHGLVHMYWDDHGIIRYAEFYQSDETTGMNRMTPPDIVREHIEAYFEILHHNNFTTDIKSFIPPCFRYTFSQGDDQLSAILSEYGIQYISTPFLSMQSLSEEKPVGVGVENGIINVDRTRDLTRWEEVDAKTPDIIKKSYYGMHWPNFLHHDPERNGEPLSRWIEYFRKYEDQFEIMKARDNAQGSTQALYKRFTKITLTDDSMILNFSDVDHQKATGLCDFFFLQAKNQLHLTADKSMELFIHKIHENHTTYKVTRKSPYSEQSIITYSI